MTYKLLVPLIPEGKWAKAGAYDKLSNRALRFDIELQERSGTSWETLDEIRAEEFRMRGSPNAKHSGDQGIERIVERYRDRVPKDRLNDFDRLIEMWRKYHLNGMTAGTEKQMEIVDTLNLRCVTDYKETCKILEQKGLLVDRGYKYGTKWLLRPIPKEDLDFIHKICEEWSEQND